MKSKKVSKKEMRKAAKRARSAVQPPIVSRDTVLNTVELLELILLHVDMGTLITSAQRVSQHWNRIITTSPALQQHLFFSPCPPSQSPKQTPNPLLPKYFHAFFATWSPEPNASIWQHRDEFLPLSWSPTGVLDNKTIPLTLLPFCDMANGRKVHLAFTRESASWRKMYISQPPPKRVARIRETQVPGWNGAKGTERTIISLNDGLKMGELYDTFDGWIWKRFGNMTQKWKKSPEEFQTPVFWIGWNTSREVGPDETIDPTGLNKDGRREVPQSQNPRAAKWLVDEAADLVIGEMLPRGGYNWCNRWPGRCRLHYIQNSTYGWNHPFSGYPDCCRMDRDGPGFAELYKQDKLFRTFGGYDYKRHRYYQTNSEYYWETKWQYHCEVFNETGVAQRLAFALHEEEAKKLDL
ncbi:hypothetical protein QBC35DRAFT_507198 [Podospora australis]|uniref:F-box domain-containing protein n=1 Tax=Podospora australis TaxID=1536484 RepID=A0AAN6WKK1_9PEZI|nr:hypothetical protein QBC35DRAFT_507198 [Podospora australis]